MADIDQNIDESDSNSDALTSSRAFPALVALWFAALFGGGCLFLPPVLFDMIFGGSSPFGPQTRVVFALVAAGVGLLLGLFIASRVRGDAPQAVAPRPSRSRKRDARPPLDVRAALGLGRDDDEDDEDEDEHDGFDADEHQEFEDEPDLSDEPDHDAFDLAAYDLTDDAKPPIDDPHFASAWSDSDAYDAHEAEDEPVAGNDSVAESYADEEWDEAPAPPAPAPAPPASPSRYNPFADFVREEEDEPVERQRPSFEPARFERPNFEQPQEQPEQPAPRDPAPVEHNHAAPPPPPVWPQPRSEEPALGDLGVAELVERLARALQGQKDASAAEPAMSHPEPSREGSHRNESALSPGVPRAADIDRALRGALDRLSRLDDVA